MGIAALTPVSAGSASSCEWGLARKGCRPAHSPEEQTLSLGCAPLPVPEIQDYMVGLQRTVVASWDENVNHELREEERGFVGRLLMQDAEVRGRQDTWPC